MNLEVTYYPKEDIQRAASEYETPFFLYSEARIRENCRRIQKAFGSRFKDFWPLYAVKANPNPAVLKVIQDEGFGFDASSEAEVWICDKIDGTGMHTGNYTPASEFKAADEADFILNLDDISLLDAVKEIGVPETLSFRINPGVGNATNESCVTAGPNAKYGVPHEKAVEAYRLAKEAGVKKFGIHMMTGSNVPIGEKQYFADIVRRLFEVVRAVRDELGVEIELMNIGGGFGVPYRPEEVSLDMEELAQSIREVFDEECSKHGLKEPRLMIEPGRWVTADAGWLVSKVRVIKDSYKKFVGIDASSNDMPRPSIYDAYHHVSVLSDSDEVEVVSVVGTICENNDQFAKDRELPKCNIGDIVVIHNCGAHAHSMGHNYNGKPRHAEYMLREDGSIVMIRRAETIEDLFKTVEI